MSFGKLRLRRRPHPARGARILTGGMSAAAMLAVSGAMANQLAAAPVEPVAATQVAPTTAPAAPEPQHVVIVRKYVYAPTPAAPANKPLPQAVVAPPPPVNPAPAPAPDATSGGSGA